MTLRELHAMHTGRAQMQRNLVLCQAQLVVLAFFGGATQDQLEEFIRCGRFPGNDGDTIPPGEEYDRDEMREIVRLADGALGVLSEKQ